MLTRYVYLIRHGRYHMDKGHEHYGYLDDLGRRQAVSVGRWMRGQEFDTLQCSPLPRAVQTGELACETAKFTSPVKRLRDIRECIPTVPVKYADDPDWQRYKKPARLQEKQQRLARVFARMMKRPRENDRYDVIFAHGNVIRYLCCLAMECDPDAWINMQIHHGSITCLTVSGNGRIKLAQFNSVEHMAPTLRTS